MVWLSGWPAAVRSPTRPTFSPFGFSLAQFCLIDACMLGHGINQQHLADVSKRKSMFQRNKRRNQFPAILLNIFTFHKPDTLASSEHGRLTD